MSLTATVWPRNVSFSWLWLVDLSVRWKTSKLFFALRVFWRLNGKEKVTFFYIFFSFSVWSWLFFSPESDWLHSNFTFFSLLFGPSRVKDTTRNGLEFIRVNPPKFFSRQTFALSFGPSVNYSGECYKDKKMNEHLFLIIMQHAHKKSLMATRPDEWVSGLA